MLNPRLVEAIHNEIAQAREEGMEDDDVLWMATGAGIRLGREQGMIDEDEVSPEMVAAIKTVVGQELKQ